ncbi:hypothetical protein AGMMS49957_11410 [Synergistales bacterium]|nr:hypothetical protein AGMMS49957_11410 [Synergistales bacterium]
MKGELLYEEGNHTGCSYSTPVGIKNTQGGSRWFCLFVSYILRGVNYLL